MVGNYNPSLVCLSFLLSFLASWVALDLASRVHLHTRAQRKAVWLSVGACAMGTGIWSMHYIGMLAYQSPMPVLYDWPTVLLSMFAALVASGIALGLVARKSLSWASTLAGGVVMGGAIASMHYIGMAAMRMPMGVAYSVPRVVLSVVAAVLISVAGLRLTFGFREQAQGWSWKKAGSIALMGLAIPTMHYLGMAAAHGSTRPGRFAPVDLQHAISITALSTAGISLVSLLVLVLALVSASIDRHVTRFESALDGSTRNYTQLRKHLERLQGAFRASGLGIWECDPATQLFYVDESLRDLFGVPHDGLPVTREAWRKSVHPEDAQALDLRWQQCLATGDKYENEYRLCTQTGGTRRVRSVASILRRSDGSIKRVLGMTWDVTNDRMREQEAQEEAARFRLTLEAIGDAVIATDEETRIIFMNPAAAQLTGWEAATAVGRALGEVFVTRDESTGALRGDPVQRCIDHGGSFLTEDGVLVARHGQRFNIRKRVTLMGQGRAAVITFQDITQARHLEAELVHAATHDSLTGLKNRAAFEKKLQALWEGNRYSGRTHCLCIMDLDRFKIINDASGHIAGDALLREIARLMLSELFSADVAARMGGDEFMLLLPDTDAAAAGPRLQSLLDSISALRFPWAGKMYQITASLGLVCFDCFSPEPEILLSQADAAAFTAKRQGRNQVAIYVDEGSAADHFQEMQIAADLRRCVEEDGFELHAQPIVSSNATDQARYFEVLLRMRANDGKLVSPALFIPAAERMGMMSLIDRWVIRNTLKIYRESAAANAHYRLAINLSAESLSDATLWDFVSEQFLVSGVDPSAITFEVTETAIISNMEIARDFIRKCRNVGCCIALDDFGTGLSSLSYLKQFSLDTIKIDGAFIRTLLNNPLDQAIIRSIGDIARSVGANTVAECVEDVDTIAMLRNLNVDFVQGWATGKPLPIHSVLSPSAQRTASSSLKPFASEKSEKPDKPDKPFLIQRGVA